MSASTATCPVRPARPRHRPAHAGLAGPVEVTVQARHRTRSFLLLHGGGGTATMAGFADLLAERTHSWVLLPTHPGFDGTPKADWMTGVSDLAQSYVAMLEHLDLTDVTVVGHSFGGWVAAEIALRRSPRVGAAVIIDGIGIEVGGHPMADLGGTAPVPDVRALIGYTGPTMSDPTLAGRLGGIRIPVHVLWGESDGIVDPEYGRAYAAAIPTATFTLLPGAGHLPQIETPESLLGALLARAAL